MLSLNTLSSPNTKSRKRVGRGMGSGHGKTSGKGHKGQKSRSGGGVQVGFEGGQTPLHRRVPKFGFKSRSSLYTYALRLSELNKVNSQEITIDILKEHGLVKKSIRVVKVFLSGEITSPVHLKGIKVSKGAREKIESLGGSING